MEPLSLAEFAGGTVELLSGMITCVERTITVITSCFWRMRVRGSRWGLVDGQMSSRVSHHEDKGTDRATNVD